MLDKIKNMMGKKNKTTNKVEGDDLMEKENIEPTAEEFEQNAAENEGNEPSLDENQDETMENEAKEKSPEDYENEINELNNKYLRLYAEFDNYRKRMAKEALETRKMAAKDTLSALLPVLDDFGRAKKNAEAADSKEQFSDGVKLVYTKLFNILESKGLEAMETTGEDFDPEFHEAITEIPAPSEDMKGKIIDTIETGYMLNDKIIRHAKVVVGK